MAVADVGRIAHPRAQLPEGTRINTGTLTGRRRGFRAPTCSRCPACRQRPTVRGLGGGQAARTDGVLRLLAFVLLGLDSVAVATAVGAAGKVTGPAQ
jgi:hypothetical protein